MIQFPHQILADNDPVRFTLGWQAHEGDWTTLAEPLKIQFRRGNRLDSGVIANAEYEIEDSQAFGVNGALIVTLLPVTVLPEFNLYYDILQDNGIRFGFGSIEIKRGVSND